MRLIFATNNKHKVCEIKEILGEKYKNFVFLMSDFNVSIDPDENGDSFEKNANIKSLALYNELDKKGLLKKGDFIISDDTGLCIDYLNGEPGIHSARFLGADKSQEDKNTYILDIMKNVPDDMRTAHFITVLSVIEIIDVSNNAYKISNFEGKVLGYIAKKIEKEGGFGYDPIFAVGNTDELKGNNIRTYSNIGAVEKNKISHRARVIHSFVHYLEKTYNI